MFSRHSSCLFIIENKAWAGRWPKPVTAVRAVLLDIAGHAQTFQDFT